MVAHVAEIGPDLGIDARQSGDLAAFMQAFTGVVQFGEVGEGNLDWTEIITQAIASGDVPDLWERYFDAHIAVVGVEPDGSGYDPDPAEELVRQQLHDLRERAEFLYLAQLRTKVV